MYVFAGKLTLPPAPTRQDLDAEAARTPDVATAPVQAIGASNTDAGREHYRAGDRHAVVTGNATGMVTACAVATAEPTAPAACRTFKIEPSVAVEYPDGRYAAGITTIVVEP